MLISVLANSVRFRPIADLNRHVESLLRGKVEDGPSTSSASRTEHIVVGERREPGSNLAIAVHSGNLHRRTARRIRGACIDTYRTRARIPPRFPQAAAQVQRRYVWSMDAMSGLLRV